MVASLLGSKVGHFRIVQKIAAGGMGEVYAGFDETLQRRVALKGIRPEYHLDEAAKARFLREARILSQLGHPNICQIHDYLEGERTDFIVMELVEGRSLAQAIKGGLDGRTRMRVAEQVAEVLVAAHARGVIHRDLKPDNVMLGDGDQVKVLDFGLSRQVGVEVAADLAAEALPGPAVRADTGLDDGATHALAASSGSAPARTPTSELTTAGIIMGTIGYMSPEQARCEAATAASDMYSFGLVLQELFTGKPPYEPGLNVVALLERARNGETLPVTGVDADLTALIGRLESLEPAARPSAVDAAEKLEWIRRKPQRRARRLLMTAAAAVLVVFAAAMTVQSIRAVRAERRALQEAQTAEQVSQFLVDIFHVSHPGEDRGRTVTARELLDTGAKRIATELKDQPLVQGRMMEVMGNVYRGLGLYQDAETLTSSSLAIFEKTLPPDDPRLATILNNLAILRKLEGKYAQAEPLYTRALAIREKAFGPDHPEVAALMDNLAVLYVSQGRFAEAEPLYHRALALRERRLGPEHLETASTLNNLAVLYWQQSKYADAEPLYRRVLAIREKALGPGHLDVANSVNNLAILLKDQGRYAEAEPLYERVLAIREKALPPEHPDLATALDNMASLYEAEGKLAEAAPIYERALAMREKVFGGASPDVAVSLNNLANLKIQVGRFTEAEPLSSRALAIWERALGPNHPYVATALGNLGSALAGQGRLAEAVPLSARALAIYERALGPDHPDVAYALLDLASLHRSAGDLARAEPLAERALAIREKASGPRSPETAEALEALASCELELGKDGRALELSARGLAIARELVEASPGDARARFLLGSALLLQGEVEAAQGRGDAARSAWQEALTVLQPLAGGMERASEQATWAEVLLRLDRTKEATPIVKRLLDCGYRDPGLPKLCREKGVAL